MLFFLFLSFLSILMALTIFPVNAFIRSTQERGGLLSASIHPMREHSYG